MQATTAPGSSSGEFVDKTDLAAGTKWTATDANAWQAELLEIITEAGLTPSGADLTQVRQAIQLLAKAVKVDAASEADVLATARTIGGVSFDGSANINLPGVNTAGNQNTSGDANTVDGIHFKTIDIGDWNIDVAFSKSITHGLTLSKIRSVYGIIRNDTDSAYYTISNSMDLGSSVDGVIITAITSTSVVLERVETSMFNSANFDSTSYNRGWITIGYID